MRSVCGSAVVRSTCGSAAVRSVCGSAAVQSAIVLKCDVRSVNVRECDCTECKGVGVRLYGVKLCENCCFILFE